MWSVRAGRPLGSDLPGRGGVPVIFRAEIALNAKSVEFKDEIRVPAIVGKPPPSPEEVEASHRKWGDSG